MFFRNLLDFVDCVIFSIGFYIFVEEGWLNDGDFVILVCEGFGYVLDVGIKSG